LSAIQRKDGRTFPVAVSPQPFKRLDNGELAVLTILVDLGEVQTGRPMGAPGNSLAADLAGVALKLQSMSFSASVASEAAFPVDHPQLSELSAREREVLALLAKGSRVQAIAEQLFISQNTVRNHLKAIYRKMDVSSQSELIERVRSLGAG
jgi:DNA-binding CsgD family transcriptional regulator